METTKNVADRQPAPFLNQTEIPIDRADIRLEQALVSDGDVLGFLESHPTELAESDLNITYISGMTPAEAVVYKMLYTGKDEPEALAGLVYLIKKGMDSGSLQIAYILGQEYQGKKQGIATDSVGAVSDEIGKSYALIANIDKLNEPSIKLAERLGYLAIGNAGSNPMPYLKLRSSGKSKRPAA